MRLEILLPYCKFATVSDVSRIIVMTKAGSFGLLPRRLDCAAVLTPGLLSYTTSDAGEVHIAVDTGVLVKTGAEVLVCVRHAIAGADLGGLKAAVEQEFVNLTEQERAARATLAQLESGLIRRLLELRNA